MKTEVLTKAVEAIIEMAAAAVKSDDALKYSQAACNAANAMCALKNASAEIKPV